MASPNISASSSVMSPNAIVSEKNGSQNNLPKPDMHDIRLNGGVLAWTQVLVSYLIVFNGFGYFSSFGLFQSHWTLTLNRSASDISWVGSISLFLLFFLGMLSGPLMDSGHFKSLIFLGCGFQLLGVFTTSAVTKYWQLILSQGIVQGIGNGLMFTPCVALVSIYWTKRRAFTLSLAACGAPMGGIVFPIISRQLAPLMGYPWTIRIMGFVILFNSILIVLLARPRKLNRTNGPLVNFKAFEDPVYSLFALGIFSTLWGVYIAYFYTATFGREVVGISQADSLTLLIILNALGIPGRIIPAFIADTYFGAFNLLIPFVAGSAIMLYTWAGVHQQGTFYAFVAIYGICANAVQTLFPAALSLLTTDLSKMASRVGMVFTVGSVACLTGPPFAGWLIDIGGGSYLYAQMFGGSSMIVGCVFLSAARLLQHCRRSRSVIVTI